MKITCLIENTCENNDLGFEHGLSFYIETDKHRILSDTGASDKFIVNATKLGIDLSAVDTVVLSHGHYDHCGGVMAFSRLNYNAKIYLNSAADGDYYHIDSNENRYIGIDRELLSLPNIKLIEGNFKVDDEVFIINSVKTNRLQPLTNSALKSKVQNGLLPDDFCHEQYLEIRSNNKTVLISGCAHKGIVNIMEAYRDLRGSDPDVVISGFHTINNNGYSEQEIELIKEIGSELKEFKSKFCTCHCTGIEPYEILKEVIGEQISYISTGMIIEV